MTGRKAKYLLKVIVSILLILSIGTGLIGYHYYTVIWSPNVSTHLPHGGIFYIPTGSTFDDVAQNLVDQGFVTKRSSFEWVAEYMKYDTNVKPGRYKIEPDMCNKDLVAHLRSGVQVPVHLTFNNIRLRPELAGVVAQQIEADSISIIEMINDEEVCKKYGFDKETFFTMFIPNTYEFKWNTSAEQFISRMATEYKAYWNGDRKAKAEKLKLSQSQVSILAAIVQKETAKADEKPRVAGVYHNRIKKGMKLEADPTLIYALGDFTIHRVLNKYKEINSPYNTYMYAGLPPGPICLPEISSIDAVLNREEHDYIFFCAKEDFSGYHNFAATYAQHKVNARKFHQAMNEAKIYR